MNRKAAHDVHLAIAEAGKVLALKGDHLEALNHYREALRLAVSSRAPEVFFRHYTQCVMESLELTGAFDEVIAYCRRVDAHYVALDLDSSLHRRDHASVLERLGLVLLKKGELEEGGDALRSALDRADGQPMPLAGEVLSWLNRGYRLDAARILSSQRRHDYFVVQGGKVNRQLARKGRKALPASGAPMNPLPVG